MGRPVFGFAPWNPDPATADLLQQVQNVLDECADFLPLTLWQVFYRLVATRGYLHPAVRAFRSDYREKMN